MLHLRASCCPWQLPPMLVQLLWPHVEPDPLTFYAPPTGTDYSLAHTKCLLLNLPYSADERRRPCTTSPASSPHKLGKVGPKWKRTVDIRKLSVANPCLIGLVKYVPEWARLIHASKEFNWCILGGKTSECGSLWGILLVHMSQFWQSCSQAPPSFLALAVRKSGESLVSFLMWTWHNQQISNG